MKKFIILHCSFCILLLCGCRPAGPSQEQRAIAALEKRVKELERRVDDQVWTNMDLQAGINGEEKFQGQKNFDQMMTDIDFDSWLRVLWEDDAWDAGRIAVLEKRVGLPVFEHDPKKAGASPRTP